MKSTFLKINKIWNKYTFIFTIIASIIIIIRAFVFFWDFEYVDEIDSFYKIKDMYSFFVYILTPLSFVFSILSKKWVLVLINIFLYIIIIAICIFIGEFIGYYLDVWFGIDISGR